MTFVAIDPGATRDLAATMRLAANSADELSGSVTAALTLCELISGIPGQLVAEGVELEKVGIVITARADLAEGFVIDPLILSADLGITVGQAETALAAIAADADVNPLMDIVAKQNYLFSATPSSLRDLLAGLPPPGAVAALDAALTRLDEAILPAMLAGDTLDPGDLSDQNNADLERLAGALGGNDVTIMVSRTERYEHGRGDDHIRTIEEQVPITSTGGENIFRFVEVSIQQGIQKRRAADDLRRITDQIDRNDLPGEALRLGITETELQVALQAVDVLGRPSAARGLPSQGVGGDPAGGGDGLGDADLAPGDFVGGDVRQVSVEVEPPPNRNDYPDGEAGDEAYLADFKQNRREAFDAGRNVVGPIDSEDTALYEALGSLYGAQNLGFSHDLQASQAEIQFRDDPGVIGFDIANGVTATLGYAAAVVTAPAIGAMNAAFGTDIDLAAAGTALADSVWSGFGYTVDGPTIADVRAETIQAERQAEDDADRDRFRDRGDDADNNGFADYGDPRGTVDPNDPTDTGGSGLL